MPSEELDEPLRAAALAYVRELDVRSGGRVTQDELNGFQFQGQRVSLLQHMRGIRVVAGLPAALTIRTTFRLNPEEHPYEDDVGQDGYYRYKWQGTDPQAHDNVALRRAMEQGKMLIWFVGVNPGVFRPIYPVWLVSEEPDRQQFVLALTEDLREQWEPLSLASPADIALRRQYAVAEVRRRLHQPLFRERVLSAYGGACALCRLRHAPLLEAAHIKRDADGGEPVVPNGVAMCAIHHRAFDAQMLGIRPDHIVEIRQDILSETDGPTLRHALQGIHGSEMTLPRQRRARPDTELLTERYEHFRLAG